ncbi:MAG: IclR family transcriptional regulator domain-containing protein [Steroidobacteraceae bacterium]
MTHRGATGTITVPITAYHVRKTVLTSKSSSRSSRALIAPTAADPDDGVNRGGDPDFMTSLARGLLAATPPEQAAWELYKFELVAHTRFTVTSRRRLEEILAEARTEGFAVNDRELEIGLRSIAVPVRSVVGATVAATKSAQASRVTRRELIEKALPLLRAAAERLDSQLPPSR